MSHWAVTLSWLKPVQPGAVAGFSWMGKEFQHRATLWKPLGGFFNFRYMQSKTLALVFFNFFFYIRNIFFFFFNIRYVHAVKDYGTGYIHIVGLRCLEPIKN
jgi:hypothetical protein